MSKYSNKIKQFIRDTNPVPFNNSDIEVNSSVTLESIYKQIKDAIPNSDDITLINETTIGKIHERNQPPLLYLFFLELYNAGLAKPMFGDTIPDFNDFWKFYEWYRMNARNINYSKVDSIMVERMANPPNGNENLIDLYRIIFQPPETRDLLHERIYRNRFVSMDIQHELESTELTSKHFKIKLNDSGETADVRILAPVDSKAYDMNIVVHILKTMHALSKTVSFEVDSNKPTSLDLKIILSSQKKLFSTAKLLSADNINSGSSYPGKRVTVWRHEELYKVLIHELIHFYGFDFHAGESGYADLESKLKDTMNLNGPDHINETYTEILALIINCMMCAYYSKPPTEIDLQKRFNECMIMEKYFTLWQVAKIIKTFGGSAYSDLPSKKIEIKQSTNARSYYIHKCYVLLVLDDFIKFLDSEHDRCGVDICSRLLEFGDLILKGKTILDQPNNTVTNQINKYIIMLDSLSEDEFRWIHKTGRMSACEIVSA